MAKLLFLGANEAQVPYLLEAQKRGYSTLVTDLNPEAPGRKHADHFCQTGYDQLGSVLGFAEAHGLCSEDKIFTASAQFAHLAGAYVAAKVGISYPSFDTIATCLDKSRFYPAFEKFDVPHPVTRYVMSQEELVKVVKEIDGFIYVKSDFSKNPNYVYRFHSSDIQSSKICWTYNRNFQKFYCVQAEHSGTHLRLNLWRRNFNSFPFKHGENLNIKKETIERLGVISTLQRFIAAMGLDRFLVKFDIILSNEEYTVLDVGLDPPYRFFRHLRQLGYNVYDLYLSHYLDENAEYPDV